MKKKKKKKRKYFFCFIVLVFLTDQLPLNTPNSATLSSSLFWLQPYLVAAGSCPADRLRRDSLLSS